MTMRMRAIAGEDQTRQPATETTCNNLAAEWELSVSDFVQLNDDVDDACDDLVVGQNVRWPMPSQFFRR